MCGRFFVGQEENALLSSLIGEAARRQRALTGEDTVASGEVLPGSVAAVLALGKSGAPGAFPMGWGFHRSDGKGLIINTRSETALEKPLFADAMRGRRCLIPASWYFEWETREAQTSLLTADMSIQTGGASFPGQRRIKNALKIKYAIRPKRPGLIYLAGIYRYEPGSPLPVFSILTQPASPDIDFIHPRMPVIFMEDTRAAWLDKSADSLEALGQCERQMTCRLT